MILHAPDCRLPAASAACSGNEYRRVLLQGFFEWDSFVFSLYQHVKKALALARRAALMLNRGQPQQDFAGSRRKILRAAARP